MSLNRDRGEADYRIPLIRRSLRKIDSIIMVMSGKGGVGKSLISATIAGLLARKGFSVGLLDLDFHGPSSSIIFGLHKLPEEGENGLVPPKVDGVKIMSVDLFTRGRPIPIGGDAKREVIKELLALTHWGDTDYLIVDMPPETGDVLLASLAYLRGNRKAILISTSSYLSLQVVRRVLQILMDANVPIIGLIENMAQINIEGGEMKPFGHTNPEDLSHEYGITFLGRIPLDPEAALAAEKGDLDGLMNTRFAASVSRIVGHLIKKAHKSI